VLPITALSKPLLTPKECELIKTEVIPHLENGLIANAKLKKRVRKTQTCFILNNDEKFKKINHLMDRIVDNFLWIARDCYNRNLNFVESINYSKYENGGHYRWHIDPTDKMPREISASFFLDDPESYKGGELEFFDKAIPSPEQSQGCLCLFPSLLTHRVTKVISGERSSLVLWGHLTNPDQNGQPNITLSPNS
tara:strand:- start:36 stop:617 length:582 start_codon:yes stop_codon:yes gene_type:complete